MTTPTRIAVGPFSFHDGDDWPFYGHDALRDEGFEIVPFSHHGPVLSCDVAVWWSPEYHNAATLFPANATLRPAALTVAFVGDWHIVPFERIPQLRQFDVVATDWRGRQTLLASDRRWKLEDVWWFRGFSFDPRLHHAEEGGTGRAAARALDVAFMGRRDNGPRDALLQRVRETCDRRGWAHHIHIHTAGRPFARGEEAMVYREAEIVINLAQRGELNMRTYEAAACGALSVIQHATDEVYAANAPIPTYAPAHVEAFLEAWLGDPTRRAALLQRQHEWVQHERPVDHLRWLCRRIRERLAADETPKERKTDGRMAGVDDDCARAVVAPDPPACGEALPRTLGDAATAPPAEPPVSDQRQECVALVPATARRVLDVGCGSGGFGWALKQARPGIQVDGIERDRVAFGATHGRLDSRWWMDVEAPEWPAADQFPPGTYDCIACLDVLEHLRDPWRALTRLRPLLTHDGCLVASLPNIRNAANLFLLIVGGEWRYFRHGTMAFRGPQDNVLSWEHLRFFTHDSVEQLFRECGYRIVRWGATRYTPPPADTAQERWHDELVYLVALHGGDADAFTRDALTLQHLVVAQPDWEAAPLPA